MVKKVICRPLLVYAEFYLDDVCDGIKFHFFHVSNNGDRGVLIEFCRDSVRFILEEDLWCDLVLHDRREVDLSVGTVCSSLCRQATGSFWRPIALHLCSLLF